MPPSPPSPGSREPVVGDGVNPTVLHVNTNGGSSQTSLIIQPNSTFDLNNNHFFINYCANPDPVSTIRGYLVSGFNNGAWTGTGIDSAAAAANSSHYGIGYADSADPGNPAGLASNQIELQYTLLGDVDLNKVVNGVDFGILAANFNHAVSRWDQGDFNYDNIVNGIDFAELAANFNQGASNAADWASLISFAQANGLTVDVPEPTASANYFSLSGDRNSTHAAENPSPETSCHTTISRLPQRW